MKKRALVVDDDPDSRAIAREALARAGFEVEEAADGIDALSSVERSRPDVVLLDLAMPRMDGWETARRMKKAGLEAGIVAVTAHALAGDRDKALAAGCDDYLAKAFQLPELRATVARHLRSTAAVAGRLEPY